MNMRVMNHAEPRSGCSRKSRFPCYFFIHVEIPYFHCSNNHLAPNRISCICNACNLDPRHIPYLLCHHYSDRVASILDIRGPSFHPKKTICTVDCEVDASPIMQPHEAERAVNVHALELVALAVGSVKQANLEIVFLSQAHYDSSLLFVIKNCSVFTSFNSPFFHKSRSNARSTSVSGTISKPMPIS